MYSRLLTKYSSIIEKHDNYLIIYDFSSYYILYSCFCQLEWFPGIFVSAAPLQKQITPVSFLTGVFCYPIVSNAARAASCSARFLLLPDPQPMVVPFSLTSTSNRLSWSGPDSPMST